MAGGKKLIVWAAVLVLVLAGSAAAYAALKDRVEPFGAMEAETEKIAAIDFTVVDRDGNACKLSDWVGTPVVLNFWASWCPPCKEEMPAFDEVYREFGGAVQFMMVDLVDGVQETVATGSAYIDAQGFSFPVYYDTTGEAGYVYGIRSIPTTIFIDKDGYVITGAQGAISADTLRRGIGMIRE